MLVKFSVVYVANTIHILQHRITESSFMYNIQYDQIIKISRD